MEQKSHATLSMVYGQMSVTPAPFSKKQNIQSARRRCKNPNCGQRNFLRNNPFRKIYKHSIALSQNFEIKFVSSSLPAIIGIYDKKELLVYFVT